MSSDELRRLPEGIRRELLRVLFSTSQERARVIARLFAHAQTRALADLLADLEGDEDLRARVEIELLHSLDSRQA
jgi:hypothetical protein